MIDSADHAGAFVGAILTGIKYVHIFGVVKYCKIIAVLKLVRMLFLIHLLSQKRKMGSLN
jgi:hypothetical protein